MATHSPGWSFASLTEIIRRRKLTQSAAAKLLGVTQPRVSDLVRGKVDLFSIDTLVDMISKTGGSVQVAIKGTRKAA
jgi:predicted XRE-type DNA-binding protein